MPSKNDSERVAKHTNGFAVRDMRIARHLSITEFAQKLTDAGEPTNPNSIINIEKGRRDASPRLEAAMAHVLRCSVMALIRCPGCVKCSDANPGCPVCEREARAAVDQTLRAAA